MTENEETERSAWVSIASPEGGGTHLRITDREDGGWAITGVYVHGPEVMASMLQAVPISQLSMVMNLTTNGVYDLQTIIKYGGHGLPTLDDDAGDVSTAVLRDQAEDAPQELRLIEPLGDRPRLTRPDGSDPDAFYERVGNAYREYAPRTRAPAVEIAKEAGVPVATVRSWIREARRRGHLPPGRKGKAG